MPGLDRASRSRAPPARDVHIVFVTAFDQYAVEAFERAAVDYLLKPVSDERLAETVARLKARLAAAAPAPELAAALAAHRAAGAGRRAAAANAWRGSARRAARRCG